MTLRSPRELANTRGKLQRIEEQYEAARQESVVDERIRELELPSVKG